MILRNIIAIPRSRHLRRISLLTSGVLYSLADDEYPTALKNAIGETTYQEWLELDRLLPRLWESQSIKISRETREAFASNLYPLSNIGHL